MNGELALVAALAAIGGRWLRSGATVPEPDLTEGNSAFQYVGAFTADIPARGLLRRKATATSAEAWLRALRSRQIAELSLITDPTMTGPLSPHVASAFSNSGPWALLATGQYGPTMWTINWEVGDRNAPQSRIWSLTASGYQCDGCAPHEIDVAHARGRLRAALTDIRAFAERATEVREWASWFAKAESLLDDPEPMPPYHADLLPRDASLERRQLAAAVVQAWVFGGMGSWNDGGCADPVDQREYERVGAKLYAELLVALSAAANNA